MEFTYLQLTDIAWALSAGLEQQRKFLRHDDWDADLSRTERHKRLAPDRVMARARKSFINAWSGAK